MSSANGNQMTESDNATIPMKVAQAPKKVATETPIPKKPTSTSMMRISAIAVLLGSLLGIGWGAWQFVHSPSAVDDDESIADLEGFESASESPGKTLDLDNTRQVRPSIPKPFIASTPSIDGLKAPDSPAGPISANEPAGTADVWLTGTIEEAKTNERIKLPMRLSGGPSESPILR